MRDFVNLCLTRIGSGEWRAMVINVSVVGLKEADKSTVDSAREFLGWLKQVPRCEVVFVSASDNVHTITITYRR